MPMFELFSKQKNLGEILGRVIKSFIARLCSRSFMGQFYILLFMSFSFYKISRYGAGIETYVSIFSGLLPVSVSYQAMMCIPWRAHVNRKFCFFTAKTIETSYVNYEVHYLAKLTRVCHYTCLNF